MATLLALVVTLPLSSVAAQLPAPAQGDLTAWPPPSNIWPIAVRPASVRPPNAAQQAQFDAAVQLLCDYGNSIDVTQGSEAERREKKSCKKILDEACEEFGDPGPEVFVGDIQTPSVTALTMPDSRSGQATEFTADTDNLVCVDAHNPSSPGDTSGLDDNGNLVLPVEGGSSTTLGPQASRWLLALTLLHEFFHTKERIRDDATPLETCSSHVHHSMIYLKVLRVAGGMPFPGGTPLGDQRNASLFEQPNLRRQAVRFILQARELGWPIVLV